MIKEIAVTGSIIFLLAGCAAPFSKYYYDQTGGIDVAQAPTVVHTEGKPRLLRGNSVKDDSLKMLEEGYAMIGYSSFNAGNVNEKGALSQAKKVHAAAVIIYSKYTNTVSGAMPLTLPNTQTSSTSLYGSAYGSGGYANYSGNAYTTTYGTRTAYIPYSVRRSDYLATYWVKLKKPIFGAHLRELSTETRQELGSNHGMMVNAVIDGSPAFQADILRGDILRKIGNLEIASTGDFQTALKRYQGKSVSVVVFRNGETLVKKLKLNRKH